MSPDVVPVRSEREGQRLAGDLLQRAARLASVPVPRLRVGRGTSAHVSGWRGREVVTVGRDALTTRPYVDIAWKVHHEVGHLASHESDGHRRDRRWNRGLGGLLVLYGVVLLAGMLVEPITPWPLTIGTIAMMAALLIAALGKCAASRACEVEADQWAARNGAPMTHVTVAYMTEGEPSRWPVLFRTHPAPASRQRAQWSAAKK